MQISYASNSLLWLRNKKRPGFRDVEILRQADDPSKVFFFEHWDDLESYQNYVKWRTDSGDMDSMAEMMTEQPTIQVWPHLIAKKVRPNSK